MVAIGVFPSGSDVVISSETGAKRMLCTRLAGCPTRFGVFAMLVIDHPGFDVSPAFFKESIIRLIITERYLLVVSLQ